ncbi:hypothetical protein CcI6DRAFT_01749 [Frankia sp. CcI6]|nr:hypothetical protein CcI6DRAFT_01749 [Frankia sp. CcI6]KDA44328.1 hypothetical protein BMG523Draft_00827 [Frankia sp. BMG5.23]OAA31461.1 hypothetical protein AAY23_10024 [Frankia casuarinae]
MDDVVLCPPPDAGRRIDLSTCALAEPDLISAYSPDLTRCRSLPGTGNLRRPVTRLPECR